ncbi:MAG TPA: NHL repeat-containing protein [Solirubrobacterales bacterium]|nr:NHL repeat-containing protein [Solirubrobacterales bacterium]
MRSPARRAKLIALLALACCAAAILPAAAGAAPGDPLFVLRPMPQPGGLPPLIPPPAAKLEGPCGLAVDASGDFYVADYYHHAVDVYTPDAEYVTQMAGEDPLDGPCGLALGPGGDLYVNNFHRNVAHFGPRSGFGAGTLLAGVGVDASHPTGVAVDGSGAVYVDERDRIATFDPAGVEGEPIGVSGIADGYGVAVSAYPATAGFVYVPDAATETVKVYDPAASRTEPVAQIDGSATPAGRFVSLRDSSVAVDDVTGTVYVVDDLTPEYREGHEGVVYAFGPSGAYLGRLKYSVQTALPAGLAVDNSAGATQGRVYVTSGYSELAAVYAYPPGSAGAAAIPLPAAPGVAGVASAAPAAPAATAQPAAATAAAPVSSPASASTAEPAIGAAAPAAAAARHKARRHARRAHVRARRAHAGGHRRHRRAHHHSGRGRRR